MDSQIIHLPSVSPDDEVLLELLSSPSPETKSFNFDFAEIPDLNETDNKKRTLNDNYQQGGNNHLECNQDDGGCTPNRIDGGFAGKDDYKVELLFGSNSSSSSSLSGSVSSNSNSGAFATSPTLSAASPECSDIIQEPLDIGIHKSGGKQSQDSFESQRIDYEANTISDGSQCANDEEMMAKRSRSGRKASGGDKKNSKNTCSATTAANIAASAPSKNSASKTKKKTLSKVDKTALRKIKNRESASRSYLRKKAHMSTLEEKIASLQLENRALKEENLALKTQIEFIKDKELLMEDVAMDESDTLPLFKQHVTMGGEKSDVSSGVLTSFSQSSLVKSVVLPIAAISSTVCMVDNTASFDRTGRSLSIREEGGSYLVGNMFAVLLVVLVSLTLTVLSSGIPSAGGVSKVKNEMDRFRAGARRIVGMSVDGVMGVCKKKE